jgi:hypothetical protein
MGVLPRRRVLVRLGLLAGVALALGALYSVVHAVLGGSHATQARFRRLDLTTEQCVATFPGLTREIEDAVARGPFRLERWPDHATGITQGKIEDGKVGSGGSEVWCAYADGVHSSMCSLWISTLMML